MADLVSGNAAIGQSGGPTAVINQSLAGVIEGLRAGLANTGHVKRVLGMRHGVRGIVKTGGEGHVDPRQAAKRVALQFVCSQKVSWDHRKLAAG